MPFGEMSNVNEPCARTDSLSRCSAFQERPFHFSTYVVALIDEYAIVARTKLGDRTKILDAGSVRLSYPTVNDGTFDKYFVCRAGEWPDLEIWSSIQAARKANSQAAAGERQHRAAIRGGEAALGCDGRGCNWLTWDCSRRGGGRSSRR
jgi:hypothetical protein